VTSEPGSILTLKRMMRDTPGSDEIKAILADLFSEKNDQAFAVTIAAILDGVVERTVRKKLVCLNKREEKELFDGTGPLATFSARIRIGYALGLFDRFIRDDLETIREIRNAFAHTKKVISFDSAEVSTVCTRLILAENVEKQLRTPPGGPLPKGAIKFPAHGRITARSRFGLTATLLVLDIDSAKTMPVIMRNSTGAALSERGPLQ